MSQKQYHKRNQFYILFKSLAVIWLGIMLASFSIISAADNVTVSPTAYGYGTDGGAVEFNWDTDGVFDVLTVGSDVRAQKYQSLDFTKRLERRGTYEFAIPQILTQPGVTLDSAILFVPATAGNGYFDSLIAYGYGADGVVDLDDFANIQIQVGSDPISSTKSSYQFDVTTHVNGLIGSANYAGYVLAASWWDAYVTMTPNAELQLTYTVTDPTANTPPDISVQSPQEGMTYYENTPILFAATATDQEDGDITSQANWNWPYYPLPAGPSFNTTVFYPGTHTVTASVTDTAGVTSSIQVTFVVISNSPPELSILSPADGGQFTEGQVVGLQASANDAQQGDLSTVITWSSNIDGLLGSGAQLDVYLTPGSHTITATVTDDGNETTTASITLTVFPLVNTPPQVTINTPVDGLTISEGQGITLQGAATDLEDGDLSAVIKWASNLDGDLGMGANISPVSLSVGTHSINATVVDSSSEYATAVSTVVVNPYSPSYCDARGNNVYYMWLQGFDINGTSNYSGANGGYFDFTSQTPIELVTGNNNLTLTPGYVSTAYNVYWGIWIDFNNDSNFSTDEQIYNGNSNSVVTGVATIPNSMSGTVKMRIVMRYGAPATPCGTFSYGEVEDYLVNIMEGSGIPPEPVPVSYCSSRGSNSSYEWINAVNVNGYTFTTGSNSGYVDHTAETAFNLSSISNAITLTPGFGYSSYTEYWNVWIDSDQDGIFSAQELIVNGVSNQSVASNFQIPVGTLSGMTRMRVSMRYGGSPPSCGTFTYGEVEDFTVNIP